MNKKTLIALADIIRRNPEAFPPAAIDALAKFCRYEDPAFKETRWREYIAGNCGPNGGKRP